MEIPATDLYLDRTHLINNQIKDKIQYLTKSCCEGSTFDPHGRERTKAKYHQRIEQDIGNTADHQSDHSYLHIADTLKDFFVCKVYSGHNGKKEYNRGIADAKAANIFI